MGARREGIHDRTRTAVQRAASPRRSLSQRGPDAPQPGARASRWLPGRRHALSACKRLHAHPLVVVFALVALVFLSFWAFKLLAEVLAG